MQIDREKLLQHINSEIIITKRQHEAMMTKQMKDFTGGALNALRKLEIDIVGGKFDVDSEGMK